MKRKAGDRVVIVDSMHPYAMHCGELIAYESYGLGWAGWRIKLDGNHGECYADDPQLMGPARVDSIKYSRSTKRRKR